MNKKIISILQSFTETDIKDFKKFLASPYFSRGRNLTKYFDCLMKYYPLFEIEKDKFLKSYFGKKDNAAGKQSQIIRTLNFDLSKILEDFLTECSLKNNRFYPDFLLIEEYYKRGLFETGELKVEEALASKDGQETGYIKEMQMMLMTNSFSKFKRNSNKNIEIYDAAERQSEEMLSFFFGLSMNILNSFCVNSSNYKIEKNTEQLSHLLNNFDFDKFLENFRPDYPNYERIKLDIFLIGLLLKNQTFNKNLYQRLNDVYVKAFDSLDMEDKANYFNAVMNCYTFAQSEELVNLKFDLIKFGISNGLFPSKGVKYMNTGNLKMFMLAGLHANEISWAEAFVNEYIEKISPDFKENFIYYTSAYIRHYKQEYLKSLDAISLFKFGNEVYTYDMKLMQLKNFYELAKQSESYLENLNYSIDAFLHFLKDNKKVSASYRKLGKDFAAGLRLLIKINFDSGKKDKEKIKFDLEFFLKGTNNIWLINKIKEVL